MVVSYRLFAHMYACRSPSQTGGESEAAIYAPCVWCSPQVHMLGLDEACGPASNALQSLGPQRRLLC